MRQIASVSDADRRNFGLAVGILEDMPRASDATNEIDRYLADLDDTRRRTLEAVRASILDVVPDAEQGLAYGMPAFKVAGKAVAGFASYAKHLSYLPHSGSVLAALADDVAGYETSKGALKFAIDKPLPKRLVRKLIRARMVELGLA